MAQAAGTFFTPQHPRARLLPSFLHVLPILPKLKPEHREEDGYQKGQAAGDEVCNGQEVVLTSKPGQRGQHYFLSASEVLHREVWKARGQGCKQVITKRSSMEQARL